MTLSFVNNKGWISRYCLYVGGLFFNTHDGTQSETYKIEGVFEKKFNTDC